MSFASLEFLAFLPVVFALYWLLRGHLRFQNVFLLLASYVFYGWWDWRFLALIAFTSLSAFVAGIAVENASSRRSKRVWCLIGLSLNLVVLGVFKYYNFFADSVADVFSLLGFVPDWATLNMVLPVGISFYTFQALSYIIDVRRGVVRATHNAVDFFAYISFFPQLVAGPIERATTLLPQFGRLRWFDYREATDGLRQMLWGFFKKMVVADNCAVVVNMVWSDYHQASGSALALAALLFAFQIYGDFSGYSDIAIGCAKLFGFKLTRNFRYPYFATDIRDFWRRWHVSLMRWFTEYVYIPLGGSRVSKSVTVRNIFVVFALSGLWHGANWTFVVWGGYHAALLVLARYLWPKSAHPLVGGVVTFFLVVLGWVVFRAPSIGDACDFLSCMVLNAWNGVPAGIGVSCTAVALMMCVEWLGRNQEHALQFRSCSALLRHSALRYTLYAALLVLITTLAGTKSQFIYFQF